MTCEDFIAVAYVWGIGVGVLATLMAQWLTRVLFDDDGR